VAANPIRTCLACGQTDDHPRHVIGLPDGNSINYHMDCCVVVKNCEHCTASLEGSNEAKGDDLRAHIIANAPTVGEAE
jgi:hypothetical protein